ncbi:hypothetical protein DFJ74DRAFT_771448 [Hyaloraphidium curvatum]|nr:hypothetical protein DFJ74DRAFT_771448 [Hyaloraphidium curvatum]
MPSLVRCRVHWSTVVDAPVSQVWAAVRDFTGQLGFFGYKGFYIEDGGADNRVGATVRVIPAGPGKLVREILEAHSDRERTLTYHILWEEVDRKRGAFPGSTFDYHGTMRLREVADGDRTYATWDVEFETEPENREKMEHAVMANVTKGLLTKIKNHFAKAKL